MKNFESHYSVEGTSALDSCQVESSYRQHIIEFPSCNSSNHPTLPKKSCSIIKRSRKVIESAILYISHTDSIQDLRYGSSRGIAFNQIKKWQAVFIGSLMVLSAFLAVLINV